MICVLAGGVGAARFLRGLLQVVDPAEVRVIVNTGDDTIFHGLHVAPDIDTCVYTLAGAIDPERGWGLAGESWTAMAALKRYEPFGAVTWFNLGDQDLSTHLWRTGRMRQGATLTEVTAELTAAWGLGCTLLPMSDQPVSTHVCVDGSMMPFQEYFVGHHHSVAVTGVEFVGIGDAGPGPDVIATIETADAIVIAPSNPIVSIGPVVGIEGIRDAVRKRRDVCVAVSPIIGGAALKGPADRMLVELGHESSSVGVARLYADIASVLVLDHADTSIADDVAAVGVRPVVTDTIMRDSAVSAALARTVLASVGAAGRMGR